MVDPADVPLSDIHWPDARRIIRSVHPPIDLFEDIAEPEDWPLLIAAEQKTNPRLMASIGQLDLIPPDRRVGGPGASFLMAPFTHTSPDRPSRFSDGRLGVLYVASDFETAVEETIHHHARFMAATAQAPGWTAQFRELVMTIEARLHDLRGAGDWTAVLDPDDYTAAQTLGHALRTAGSDGLTWPSVRGDGDCAGLFYPDRARDPVQGRHLDYHWDGERVDLVRDAGSGEVFRVV